VSSVEQVSPCERAGVVREAEVCQGAVSGCRSWHRHGIPSPGQTASKVCQSYDDEDGWVGPGQISVQEAASGRVLWAMVLLLPLVSAGSVGGRRRSGEGERERGG